MKRRLFLLATAVALASFCLAQSELPATIGKGRILTTDGQKITFTHFEAGGENYTYQTGQYENPQAMPPGNVIHIQQQTGTEAGKWALWIGLSGLTGSLLGVLQAQNNINSIGGDANDVNYAPIVIGLTAGSALIGAAIGSGKKKYETVYTNPEYAGNPKPPFLKAGLSCSAGQGMGVGLSLRF